MDLKNILIHKFVIASAAEAILTQGKIAASDALLAMTEFYKMMKFIDNFLNQITMYRLVLYTLIALLTQAAVFGALKIVRFSPLEIIISTLVLLIVSWIANLGLAKAFNAHANTESVYITALILALIINPAQTGHEYIFLVWAAVLAMASKFILAIGKKHIFNPAAIAVVITSYAIGQYASWWVGTTWMLPLVLISGLLITRKTKSYDMVFSFVAAALLTSLTLGFLKGTNVTLIVKEGILSSPLLFFAFIMLTEPLTAPPTKTLQSWYGVLVGFLFAPQVHILTFYFSPEMALAAGNIFAYIVSPKQRLILTLKEKIKLSPDIYDFVFSQDKMMKFWPGQYLEWTLNVPKPDSRGNRRYFTIASSPTEKDIIMGVKFYDPSSSFKKTLLKMQPGDQMVAGQLAGDFTLPKNSSQKLAFIAGGIGITPFRSMVKYLIDQNEKRDITMFFANKSPNDVIYKELLDEAQNKLGIKTVYSVTKNEDNQPWSGEVGYIDANMVKEKVPDYMDRIFYISGPKTMIDNFKEALSSLGVKKTHIKTDFFPGFI